METILPFDDRDGSIWLDGRLIPWRDAKLHVLSHGLHYASAVFEGERVYSGTIFRSLDHTKRLFASAKALGFEIPFTIEEIEQAKLDTVAAMGFNEGYVRPIAWRGSEMMGVSAQASRIHVAIAAWEWPAYFSPEAKLKGIRMKTGRWRRPAPDTAPVHAKATGLYMICTMNKHEVEAQGYHDALMLDYRGFAVEGTGANLFMVKEGKLYTPKPDCFLNGITRQTVMALADKRQIPVVEQHITPEELMKGEEVFVTGTAAEVTPVGSIDDHAFTVGRITQTLMEDYSTLVRNPAAQKAA